MSRSDFRGLDADLLLADILRRVCGARIFDGPTTPEERRERIRAAILENGLSSSPCIVTKTRRETFAQTFKRRYRIPLESSPCA